MIPVHTDPHFLITDQAALNRLLARFHVSADERETLLFKLGDLFACMPYENLTKMIKSDSGLSAGHAKRLPDEVIRDYLHYGAGGTCFSLTATFIAVLSALGIEAHPLLADRRYGTDTHCALMLAQEGAFFLLDPGYLLFQPVQLPTHAPVNIPAEMNTLELAPKQTGRQVDLYTVVNRDRRFRLTYKVAPVDGPTFGRAWERSFAWEMMTYPVLSRYQGGVHYYLQDTMVRIRRPEGSVKQTFTGDEQCQFMHRTLGIHTTIIHRALGV